MSPIAYDSPAPAQAAQGGIVKTPQQQRDEELQRYLMQMGGLNAEQKMQTEAAARAKALRGEVQQGALMDTGRFMVAPSWGASLANSAAKAYTGYQQGQAEDVLQGLPGRRAGVKLPGW